MADKTYYDPKDLRKFGKITEWSEELDPSDCDHPWAFGMACQTSNY